MHEYSLLNDLIKKIEMITKKQKAVRVIGVKVKLGALSHISADHFRGHFDEAVKGTMADGAVLEIEQLTDETDDCAQDIMLDSVEISE